MAEQSFYPESTEIGLGSGGRYSDPDDPICAGCEKPITDEKPIWEAGTQWHNDCLPPMLREGLGG